MYNICISSQSHIEVLELRVGRCKIIIKKAQEFLRAFLDSLNIELNINQTKPKYRELSADYSKSSYQNIVLLHNYQSEEWWSYFRSIDNSIVTELFCGQLLNQIQCSSCGDKSIAFDDFLDLSLPFTQGLRMLEQFTLERAFDGFLKEEILSEEIFCKKCKKKKFLLFI